MAKIQIYVFRIFLLILCLGCIGCTGCEKKIALPDYRERGFSAEVQWELQGVCVCATATVPEPATDPQCQRNFFLAFHSPESMSGVLLERKNGEISLSMGDLPLSKEAYGLWIAYAELLIPNGTIRWLEKQTQNGQIAIRGIIHSEGETKTYEIFAQGESGMPKEITLDDRRLVFRSFIFLP